MTKLLRNREFEALSSDEKKKYFQDLREECLKYKVNNEPNIFQPAILRICPIIRHYPYVYEGVENIPTNTGALFLCNHSNSHDFFTIQEVFKKLGLQTTVFGASDDINLATQFVFNSCHAELFDRNDKESIENALFRFCANIMGGMYGVIFGEATWNLHPTKAMQDIKIGGANICAIANAPLIPTEFEYVEIPEYHTSESKLYSKCIVKFGKPIDINQGMSLVPQTLEIQHRLEEMRHLTWVVEGINKKIDTAYEKLLYLNHTYLKKFGAFGFTYNSKSESEFLRSNDGNPVENEFTLGPDGDLIPGITTKEAGKKFVMR